MRLSLNTWHRAILLLVGAIALLALLTWRVRHDPAINFLPGDARADWIVFPRPVYAASHPVVSLDSTFQREFSISQLPDKAILSVCAARSAEVRINGAIANLPAVRNWKDEASIEVAALLKTGTNTIEARVFNDTAPPALWLCLRGPNFSLATDGQWQSSLAGSSTRAAVLATQPRFPGPGNPVGGGEEMGQAWQAAWLVELIFAAAAAVLGAAALYLRKLRRGIFERPSFIWLALPGMLWVALFINNAVRWPFAAGFDVDDHLKYINYLQEFHRLPWPNEGYEMFQAPLFYLVAAALLSLFHLSVADAGAVLVLRGLTMLCGMAQFVFVYLAVRWLLPRRPAAALVALLLGAFLPMQLYLAHYATNELMAASLASAAVYLAVRLLRSANLSWPSCLSLGLVLGAALLTKATSLLLLPPLLLVLGLRFRREADQRLVSLAKLVALLLVMAAVGGWYYARIWQRFGTPLVGNWDPASGFPWWQDPGFHVAADYWRFGRSLAAPLFSGLNGFLDGIYSTLWGDALCGGTARMDGRTPWNYDLVVCGYLLALVPTLLILAGAGVMLRRFLREQALGALLSIGIIGCVGAGVLYLTFKVACVGQIKAFYGLAAIVPICAMAATGWDVLTRRFPRCRWALMFLLLLFAINSFAAVWIWPSAEQRLSVSRRLRAEKNLPGALAEAKAAVAPDPQSAAAHATLSLTLEQSGELEEALAEASRAITVAPSHPAGYLRLARLQARSGDYESAATQTRRALELGPEEPLAHDLLLLCLSHLQQKEELEKAAREALVVSPFSRFIHSTIGLAAAGRGDFGTALNQLGDAVLLGPGWSEAESNLRRAFTALPNDPEAEEHLRQLHLRARHAPALLRELAWLRATSPAAQLRNGAEAVKDAEEADRLTNHRDAAALTALAAAYAETHRFEDALVIAERAREQAQAAGNAALAARGEKLLLEFRAGRPYREEPGTR